jgi:hypothetical protein
MFTHSAGFKPRARRLAHGGLIRGPGSGTSDDIPMGVPVGGYIMPADSTRAIGPENLSGLGFHPNDAVAARVSNGEYAIPPEQVQSIGMQALDTMRDATHAPGLGFRPQDRNGQKPEMFFADGGGVKDEELTSPNQRRWGVGPAKTQGQIRAENQAPPFNPVMDNLNTPEGAALTQNLRNQMEIGGKIGESNENYNAARDKTMNALEAYKQATAGNPMATPAAQTGSSAVSNPAAPPPGTPVQDSPAVKAWQDEQTALRNAPQSATFHPPAGWEKTRQEGIFRKGNAFTDDPGASGLSPSAARGFNPANASSTPAAPGLGFNPNDQPIHDMYGNDMRRTIDMQRQLDAIYRDRAAQEGPRVSMLGSRQGADHPAPRPESGRPRDQGRSKIVP